MQHVLIINILLFVEELMIINKLYHKYHGLVYNRKKVDGKQRKYKLDLIIRYKSVKIMHIKQEIIFLSMVAETNNHNYYNNL